MCACRGGVVHFVNTVSSGGGLLAQGGRRTGRLAVCACLGGVVHFVNTVSSGGGLLAQGGGRTGRLAVEGDC